MADDKQFDLSRRKVLGSIGTIGVASAAAGAGTMAMFKDKESTGKNTVTAGTLDLEINWTATADQGQNIQNEPIEGGAGQSFALADVKPGDSGSVEVCYTPYSNPAWIWAKGAVTANTEGTNTEPEKEAEGSDPTAVDAEGELAQSMDAELKFAGGPSIKQGTLAGVLSWLKNGGNGRLIDASPNSDGVDPLGEGTTQCLVLDWNVPIGIGNAIQGDEMKFQLSFYAEQARHNRDVSNLTSDF